MGYRGHALVWGEAAPAWFAELPDRAAAICAVEAHVTDTCRHFAGRFHSWDVVNEPLKPGDGRPDNLRRSVFAEKIGPEYLDIAFRAARAADPKTRLVLNEFGIELDTEANRDKRRALLALLDGFKARGVPIDAIGLQSHLATATIGSLDPKVFGAFLGELAGPRPRNHADRARRGRPRRTGGDPGSRPGRGRHLPPLSRCRAGLAGGDDGRSTGA